MPVRVAEHTMRQELDGIAAVACVVQHDGGLTVDVAGVRVHMGGLDELGAIIRRHDCEIETSLRRRLKN